MTNRYGLVTVSALAHAVWALSTRAAAASEPVPFRLEYRAPPSCADEKEWLRELSRRSSRVVLMQEERAAPSLRVTLTSLDQGVLAELTAVDVDGRETRRTFTAASCAEAIQSSAWVSALWLDPSAMEQPEQEPASAVAPGEPVPVEQTNSRALPARVTPEITRPAPVPSSPPSTSLLPMQVGASAQVGDLFTGLPNSPFGFAGFLELRAWTASLVAPLLRVGYVSAGDGIGSTARGDAHISLAALRTVGCIGSWPRDLAVSLRPCAAWEIGTLRGHGESTSSGSTAKVTWHSVGALVRATLELVPLVSIDAEAGLIVPLERDRFVFGPPPVVSGYTTPALAGTFSLGFTIGARVGGPPPAGR